jgi:hypothetical protein
MGTKSEILCPVFKPASKAPDGSADVLSLLDDLKSRSSIPVRGRDFLLLQGVRIGRGTHAVPYQMGASWEGGGVSLGRLKLQET